MRVVVADAAGVDQAGELDTALVDLSQRGWLDELPEACALPYRGTADDVAYTLFTSGSTGTPKGVPIRHRNLADFLSWSIERYQAGPDCRFSQAFDLTFDPSVFDLFVSWCSGATLVVPQANEVLTPVRFVQDNAITHWFSVPSVVSIARRLRALRPGAMPGLRVSLFAGEQLTLTQAAAWADAAPDSVVENVYGPTELTITCTGYRLPADRERWPVTSNGTVPIGVAYPHLDGVLLDENGVTAQDGELCVRGSQRFRGYLDPADDRNRFVRLSGSAAAPVLARPEQDDWYRTGDRVRVEDGQWVHLGRLDDQVKIQGYRIELGEIESVLRGHPDVHDVVVLALDSPGGQVELTALYSGRTAERADLAGLVATKLPRYMVPAHYLYVDRFPVNANGKIDRRKLMSDAGALRDDG